MSVEEITLYSPLGQILFKDAVDSKFPVFLQKDQIPLVKTAWAFVNETSSFPTGRTLLSDVCLALKDPTSVISFQHLPSQKKTVELLVSALGHLFPPLKTRKQLLVVEANASFGIANSFNLLPGTYVDQVRCGLMNRKVQSELPDLDVEDVPQFQHTQELVQVGRYMRLQTLCHMLRSALRHQYQQGTSRSEYRQAIPPVSTWNWKDIPEEMWRSGYLVDLFAWNNWDVAELVNAGFQCGADDKKAIRIVAESPKGSGASMIAKCIRQYFRLDYERVQVERTEALSLRTRMRLEKEGWNFCFTLRCKPLPQMDICPNRKFSNKFVRRQVYLQLQTYAIGEKLPSPSTMRLLYDSWVERKCMWACVAEPLICFNPFTCLEDGRKLVQSYLFSIPGPSSSSPGTVVYSYNEDSIFDRNAQKALELIVKDLPASNVPLSGTNRMLLVGRNRTGKHSIKLALKSLLVSVAVDGRWCQSERCLVVEPQQWEGLEKYEIEGPTGSLIEAHSVSDSFEDSDCFEVEMQDSPCSVYTLKCEASMEELRILTKKIAPIHLQYYLKEAACYAMKDILSTQK